MKKPRVQAATKKVAQTYKERRAKTEVRKALRSETDRGRPSLYRPEYCDRVIEHMAEGASLTSFAAEVSVARSTVHEWMDEHPNFSDSVKIAKAKCASWWEKTNRQVAMAGGGNATSCIFGLKNMAPDEWREKISQEVSGPNGAPVRSEIKVVIDEETEARIAARLLGS